MNISNILKKEIIIWDNDGTIIGSKDPNDSTEKKKIILPNVEQIMKASNAMHVICSGCKTIESERQNYNPEIIIKKFEYLTAQLPIQVVAFSPAIGGTECWILIKKKSKTNHEIIIRKAHKEARYQYLIGRFKKPDEGMLIVLYDILQEEFNATMKSNNTLYIGDSWHDEQAAITMQIPFLNAVCVHTEKFNVQ